MTIRCQTRVPTGDVRSAMHTDHATLSPEQVVAAASTFFACSFFGFTRMDAGGRRARELDS